MDGRPVLIPNSDRRVVEGKAFPSIIAFTKRGELLLCEDAKRQTVTNPGGTIVAVKRKMGTHYRAKITIGQSRFFGNDIEELSPEEISAFILLKIRHDAELFLSEKVDKAVITVPACFDDNQRGATKDAATIAGMEVVRIISESTASALAYCHQGPRRKQKIVVFELGGGSFGVTALDAEHAENGRLPVLEVLATSGNNRLGGIDMDDAIIEHLTQQCYVEPDGLRAKAKRQEALDGKTELGAYIREVAEKAKIELSTALETQVHIPPDWGDGERAPIQLAFSRSQLEELVRPIVERCRGPMNSVLDDAKLKPTDIDKIILVGGPTRMPIVKKFVEDYMGKKPEGDIDPLACAAYGAAIQAGILAGEASDALLLDVIPLSLGVETQGGVSTRMIERNSTIPIKRVHTFSTVVDNQRSVRIHVLQGERPMAADCISLGFLSLDDIPPAKRGVPQFDVSFDIDANGILRVTAGNLATKKTREITITAPHRLRKEQLKEISMRTQRTFMQRVRDPQSISKTQ